MIPGQFLHLKKDFQNKLYIRYIFLLILTFCKLFQFIFRVILSNICYWQKV